MNNALIPQPPFVYATPKRVERQACDRCHGHKVRCTRAPSGRSCVRCQRAGATCVYSSPVKRSAASKGDSTASTNSTTSSSDIRNNPHATQDRSRRRAGSASGNHHHSIHDEADRHPMAYLHHPQQNHPPVSWLNTRLLTPLTRDFETAFPALESGFSEQLHKGLGSGSDTAPATRSHSSSRSSNTSLMDTILADDHHHHQFSLPREWQAPFPHELDFLNEPPASAAAAAAPLSPEMSDKPSAPEQPPQKGQPQALRPVDETIKCLFNLHLALYRRSRPSSSASSAAGSSIHPHPPSSPTNTSAATTESETAHLIESSQSLIVIVHSLSRQHQENQLEIDGAIALSLIACYIQLLVLYDDLASTHSYSSERPINDGGGGRVSVAPPSLPALEAGLKVQLAMHLLTRLSQGLKGLFAFARDVLPASTLTSASASCFLPGLGNNLPRPQYPDQKPAASMTTRERSLHGSPGLQLSGPVEALLRGLVGYEAALNGKLNEVVAGLMKAEYF